jgi:TonB family protein
MDSLFSQRPFRKRRLFLAGAGAVLFEGTCVLIAAVWPLQRSYTVAPVETDILAAPILGEPSRELVAPPEEPGPTPDTMPTPPPEDSPTPDDTPPPSDDPGMETPPPKKENKPKVSRPSPPGAKRGNPQAGVVNGVRNAEKSTGASVATRSGAGISSLSHPKPPYPAGALMSHIEGSGSVRVYTDSTGHVVKAEIVQSSGSGLLDHNTTSFAVANWVGAPNSTYVVPITYRLQ